MEELNLKDLFEYYVGKIWYIILIMIISGSLSVQTSTPVSIWSALLASPSTSPTRSC